MPPQPVPDSRGLCRERPHLPADYRYSPQGVPSLCRLAGLLQQVSLPLSAFPGLTHSLTFGAGGKDPETGEVRKGWGYYETIAGGSGAGPTWDGASGVHCHMTNTRITDPEILERRYPVILHQFGYRPESGGEGQYVGGNGVVREMEFLEPITVSLLTERRARAPYGESGHSE